MKGTKTVCRGGSDVTSRVRVTYPALARRQIVERLRQARIRLETKLPVSEMILYGSYAQDRYTVGSDIDIVVVYEGPPMEDAYKLVMDEIGLPRLEPKVYTREQFDALVAKSPRFAEALSKEGIKIGVGRR